MKKDSLQALKINKAAVKDRVATSFLMHQLLKEAIDGLNMSNPLADKYLLDFVDYVLENYKFEALNDWAKFCYEFSFGTLFTDGKVYRIGKIELMQTWQNFVDAKYERLEEFHRKKKEALLKTHSEPTAKKADPQYVEKLLDDWRRERVRNSIAAEKEIVKDPTLNELDYKKLALKELLKMANHERASMLVEWLRHEHTREYFRTVGKMFSKDVLEDLWKLIVFQAKHRKISETYLDQVQGYLGLSE